MFFVSFLCYLTDRTLTEAKASLIAREAAVESRRASDFMCAIYLDYPRSPEIPAESTGLLCFQMPLCRYEPANEFSDLLYINRTLAIYKSHFCDLYITFAIYKSHIRDFYITFAIYKSHFCDLYITFAIYKSHFCDLYIIFAIYKSHFFFKFLGVYIDEHLTWKDHINCYLCKRISKSIGMLFRSRF